MKRNTYTVKFLLNGPYESERSCSVIAGNKAEAYDLAVYEVIPEQFGGYPYSAWVYSVTYQNGNYKVFNTCSGNPY